MKKAYLPNVIRVVANAVAILIHFQNENVLDYIVELTEEELHKLDTFEAVSYGKISSA